jgi:UDP-N-acetyl-2-amino-2-deoxyglucuronate dehydrogenase
MLHAGLLGAGNITETHGRAAREAGIPIAAVCGSNPERVGRLARQFACAAYTELQPFLAHRPMDFIVIGSPSGIHAEQGIAAAKQGLHVLVEKPIDVRSDRARELIAHAERAGVKLGVIFQDRVKPDIQQLKRLVDDGGLGSLVLATAHVKWYRPAEYYTASRWRGSVALDGGTLLNQGIHTIDLVRWLLGPVRRVTGQVATRLHGIEAEDTAVALMEFASGALATLEATTAAFPGYPRRLELSGSNGTVVLEGDEIVRVDMREGAGEVRRKPATPDAKSGTAQQAISARSPVVSDVSPHRGIIEDFVEAIEKNRPPCCDGADGTRSVVIIEAIHASAKTGHSVDLTI